MKITLIGMSNTGKTYWAKKLEENGYTRFSCDEIIEKKLKKELVQYGYSGIEDVARWLGHPFERQHKKASMQYLSCEKESIREIIHNLGNGFKRTEDIVIDTTGSVIYIDNYLLEKLQSETLIVLLDTPQSIQKKMYEDYLANPKPVIWNDSFSQNKNELATDALVRCYPKLLAQRSAQYKRYAHITLNYYLLRSSNFMVDNLLWITENYEK